MGLGREAPHVAYPVPMILAASMGPTPKISVRAVPEASTSASMRSFKVRDLPVQRPDVTQDFRSQPSAEAGRGALRPYTAQDARGSVGRERSGYPAGHEVS